MTGRITALTAHTRTGTIRGEDGSHFVFRGAAVLGNFDSLNVGHRVSFVSDRGGTFIALNVFGEPVRMIASGKNIKTRDLRYTGFHQSANVRTYSFAEHTSRDSAKYFVTVDVALLLKHRIGVQEGPALCLGKLITDLKDSPECPHHQLGNNDLLVLIASRAEAIKQRKLRRPAVRGKSSALTFLASDGTPECRAAAAGASGSETLTRHGK